MNDIDELLDNYRQRIKQCEGEIERIGNLDDGEYVTRGDREEWIAGWQKEKAIYKDTISCLEAFQARLRAFN